MPNRKQRRAAKSKTIEMDIHTYVSASFADLFGDDYQQAGNQICRETMNIYYRDYASMSPDQPLYSRWKGYVPRLAEEVSIHTMFEPSKKKIQIHLASDCVCSSDISDDTPATVTERGLAN